MKLIGLLIGIFAFSLALSACQPASNLGVPDRSQVPTDDLLPSKTTTTTVLKSFAGEKPPSGAEQEFKTDFSIHSISYEEVLSGGPPKDGIPSIDHPEFINIQSADAWLKPVEPVIQVVINQEAKAYPLQILIWHEIVNDTVGGIPILVTFCPLCNTAIVFEREVDGQILDFGTTGRLRFSNLIMYDRQTETWWQQAEGKGIVGTLTGTQLTFVPAAIVSWDEFKQANPAGLVLSRNTGFTRSYGQNPYVGYDNVDQPPFLYTGPKTPDQLPAVARVLTIDLNNDAVAYPYEDLKKANVVNDVVGNEKIVIFWSPGTASALDAQNIAEGKDVGTAAAYRRVLDGLTLTFKFDGQNIVDEQTGSSWNVLGQALDGKLKGQQLVQIVSVNHFWFSWAAFKPDTRIYQP
jgi:hypothetical protein